MTARMTEPARHDVPGDQDHPAAGPARRGGLRRVLAGRCAQAPIAPQITELLGDPPDVAVRAFDGSRSGPEPAAAVLDFRGPAAFTRLLSAPGELGFGRAIVAGDLVIEGDLLAALELRHQLNAKRAKRELLVALVRLAAASGAPLRPLPPPPEEARVRGRAHTKHYDAEAMSHHYDVSAEFYRLFLGPSMTYTCAVWANPDVGLEAAQEAKHELICGKLGLRSGMRLLDVGCGWGTMLIHAAQHHGVTGVGITLSQEQASWARKAIAGAGLSDRLEIRVQDYRDCDDGPYDAISSIGMVEAVGHEMLDVYSAKLLSLLRPGGRLLNHQVTTPHGIPGRLDHRSFMHRYVFPDGEVHELATIVKSLEKAGFEVRHSENLREHYAQTIRAWVRNLQERWDEAVELVGLGRAQVWRIYLAGCILHFQHWGASHNQVLAVRNGERGRSDMPWRPDWT